MGLNLSNRQIAAGSGLDWSDVQAMSEQLRCELVAKAPEVTLPGEVNIREVHVVAGHKGQPAAVAMGAARSAPQVGRCVGPRHARSGQRLSTRCQFTKRRYAVSPKSWSVSARKCSNCFPGWPANVRKPKNVATLRLRPEAGVVLMPHDCKLLARMTAPVLELRDLSVEFTTDRGALRAIDAVSLAVGPGELLAIVGESGCGKSVTALACMGLLPAHAQVTGSIRLLGRELATLSAKEWQDRRGREVAMVFQEPMTSLNPAFTAGEQIAEALRRHDGLDARAAFARAVEMLEWVRIPDAARRARQYPHQLSGGMRQRVMIAMALACRPKLLIADEPTTALDVTVQAQILSLLNDLRRETGTAVILITHDLGVVADQADQVMVMYAGRVVERAPAPALFAAPQHPYTVGLLGAAPRLAGGETRLASIEGTVPDLMHPPKGCRFAPRCPFRIVRCEEDPRLMAVAPGQQAACWRAPLEQVLVA